MSIVVERMGSSHDKLKITVADTGVGAESVEGSGVDSRTRSARTCATTAARASSSPRISSGDHRLRDSCEEPHAT
jgi:hypothetical protein